MYLAERRLKLKNSEDEVILDEHVFDALQNDPHLKDIRFLENMRRHSSGCAVFQKTWSESQKNYKVETIYLHKIIAEKFLSNNRTGDKRLVGAKNGNKLDCRLENLEYRNRSTSSRKRKTTSKAGYTGVYQEHKKFRAIISHNGRAIHLGMFNTPEEAAMAYNDASRKFFGPEGKINKIDGRS